MIVSIALWSDSEFGPQFAMEDTLIFLFIYLMMSDFNLALFQIDPSLLIY